MFSLYSVRTKAVIMCTCLFSLRMILQQRIKCLLNTFCFQYKCTKPCPRYRQGCTTEKPNHICQLFCFEECQPCPIVVQKQRTVCSHSHKVQCSVDVDMLECKLPCKKMLPCGHHCKKRCSETCGDCQVKVNKLGVCGHTVKVNCCAAPTTKDCSGPCTLKLPCGHNCTKRCKDECNVVCRVLVDHTLQVACGHTFQIPCHLKAIGECNSPSSLASK